MGAPKIQTTLFLGNQLMPGNGWKEDHREMNNCSKVILVPNKQVEELYWCHNYFFFNWKGKIKCSVNGDIKMSMPRFQNGLENMLQKQSQCCGIKLEKEWQILMETKWS